MILTNQLNQEVISFVSICVNKLYLFFLINFTLIIKIELESVFHIKRNSIICFVFFFLNLNIKIKESKII